MSYVYRREGDRPKARVGIQNHTDITKSVDTSGVPDDVDTQNVKPLRDTPALRKNAEALRNPKKKKK
jgi:hypothetical protein